MTVRVDAHHHLWDLAVRPQPWTRGRPALQRSFAMGDLEPELVAAGIDATVVVHTLADRDETDELLAVAAREPRVAGIVGWFDLTRPDLADDLAAARSGVGGQHLVGARHQLEEEPDRDWLTRPLTRRGLRTLSGAGLAWDIVISADRLHTLTPTLDALPELRFVLDHAGKPQLAGEMTAWCAVIAELARRPNLAVKLSGLVTEAGPDGWRPEQIAAVTDVLLQHFGPDRVMLGSDWPVCLTAATYADTIAAADTAIAPLSPAEQAAVRGGTAAAWYGLAIV